METNLITSKFKNTMNLILIILTLSIVMLSGCDSKPPMKLTMEQAVYEALFLKISKDAHSKYYVAEVNESDWFKKNPLDNKVWEKSLKELGNINIGLVKELYKINQKSTSINWVPFITNGKLLPSEYVIGVDPGFSGKNCLVPKNKANIDVRTNDKYMRSYYTVSKVAFSTDQKTALLKVSRHCAPMSGGSEFFVTFKFQDNQWKMVGSRTLWIS